MDFADLYIATVLVPLRAVDEAITDPALRRDAAAHRYLTVWAALDVATEPNPAVAFLDMVAMAVLNRMAVEDHWLDGYGGIPEAEALLQTMREMEDEIWRQAGQVMSEEQQDELRGLIDEWRRRNPGPTAGNVARFDEFAHARLASPAAEGGGRTLFLGSVDQAARSVDETRLTVERVFYWASRAPVLLGLQTESILARATAHPPVARALDDIHAVSGTVATLPETVSREREALVADVVAEREELVARISAEREAAINQIAEKVAEERQALLRQIEEAQDEWRVTLTQLHDGMIVADQLIRSFDTMMERFEADPDEPPPDPDESGLRDFQTVVNDMTRFLETTQDLLGGEPLDAQADRLAAAARHVRESAQAATDHAFVRGVQLVLIAAGAVFVIAIALRLVPKPAARS
jgi:hypothetical protein